MKKYLSLLFVILLLSGCSNSSTQKDVLAKVNNYEITRPEFEAEFKVSPYGKTDTSESRKEFLNTLIDRKLILQYAQKEGLDREANFLKTIERFWEQSLLKIALSKKTKDVDAKLSTSGWEAKRNEETKMLNDWMSELRKQARITIKDGTLGNAADKDGGDDMNKRRNYFIDKKFQSNFILRFCFLVVATGALIMAILYAMAGKANTVSFVNSRVIVQNTANFLFPLLIQTFIVSTIVVGLAAIVVTLFVSHRIAGPLYRFKKVLASLGEGDFSLPCKIRRKDALQDVAAAFNDMITSARQNFDLIDKDLKNLKGKLEAGDIKEIKKSVSEIDKALHHFKF